MKVVAGDEEYDPDELYSVEMNMMMHSTTRSVEKRMMMLMLMLMTMTTTTTTTKDCFPMSLLLVG